MIKAILFDVDGVLVNGELFSAQLERDHGISQEQTVAFFNGEFQKALTNEADLKELLAPKLQEWGWEKSVDALLDYWFKAEHNINTELIGIVRQLKQKNIRCYIVTNQEKYRTAYMIVKMGFGEIFDQVFSSSTVKFKKPQKEFFQHVLRAIDCKGSEVIYFDDSVSYLSSAKELGIKAYLYKDAEQVKQILSEFTV